MGQDVKQPDEEGSSRSLVLSLLLDHCLLRIPQHAARLENNLPACTVPSLRARTRGSPCWSVSASLTPQDTPRRSSPA